MTTIDTRWATLHEAISILAGACDYANERDRAGFSSADTGIGHYLESVPVEDWILEYALTSQKLVRKYRRQLAGHPALELIGQAFLPAADTLLDDDVDNLYRDAREVVRRGAAMARNRAYIAGGSQLRVDGTTVMLSFPYDEVLVEESRQIAGRTYNGDTKASHYPLAALPAVVALADRHGIIVGTETRSLAAVVESDPAAYVEPNVTVDGKVFKITSTYLPRLAPELRTLNDGKATWNATAKAHRLSIGCDRPALKRILDSFQLIADAESTALLDSESAEPQVSVDGTDLLIAINSGVGAEVNEIRGSARVVADDGMLRIGIHVAPAELLDVFTTAGMRLGDGVAEALAATIAAQKANRISAVARIGTPCVVAGLGVDLFPHQSPAVEHIIKNRRLILADEMGLGKTITALAAIAATDTFPAVIACKPDLVPNWRTEVTRVLPGRKIYLAEGMTAQDIPEGTEIVIIGFNALAALAERRARTTADRYTWVEKILDLHPHAFVVDEGHLGKESRAARSQAMELVGRAVAAVDGVVLDLTGTPLVNRPRELAQQLVMLGHLAADRESLDDSHLFGTIGDFLYRYCGPKTGDYGTTFNGHSNTRELHDRLLDWGIFIRRDESAIDLPSFTMRMVTLDQQLLDRGALADYRRAETDLVSYVIDRTRASAEARGVEPTPEIMKAVIAAEKAQHLVRLNLMRRDLGRAKMPAITAWVAEQVAAGEKVMIAAHHIDVVGSYADTFGGLTIRGGQSAAAKEADKLAFQSSSLEDAPVITVSIGAGGVGHTLTAACVGVQAELCWTPGELKQMAKRIHRIGQKRPVSYIIPVVPGTSDEEMWKMNVSKQRVLDAVIDGVDIDGNFDPETEEEDAAVEVAWALSMQALTSV